MTKKGFTRLKRVLAASIKNPVQCANVQNHLEALHSRLLRQYEQRSYDETWARLNPKVGDTFYVSRKSILTIPDLWGKPIVVQLVLPRLRRIRTKDGEFGLNELTLCQFSRDIPPEAFAQLCQKEAP